MSANHFIRTLALLMAIAMLLTPRAAQAEATAAVGPGAVQQNLAGIGGPRDWPSPRSLSATLRVMLLLTVVSLAPAILLMTTSFVRILVVMGLLRQAL